ncbi:hypothetical protein EAI_11991, partial [Harpegnathos saltator]
KFFNPNICHICKAIVAYNFITCDHCHIVIYCSQEHKQLHQSQHMQICIMVKETLNMDAGWDTRRFHKEEWIHSRKKFMRLIREKLSRNLEWYEMEMIIFAKSCRTCHQQANLQTCMSCYSTNYCNDHVEIFQVVHISNCYNQLLRLFLKIALINNVPALLKFTLVFDMYESFIDMNAFVQKHLKTEPYKELSDTVLPYDYLYSQYASGPLTLYHGLRDIMFDSLDMYVTFYVIHIIGVRYQSKEYIIAWELFLHLLNHIQHLTIIMTEMNSSTEHFVIDVCTHCRERNRTINIEYYSMSYCSYVQINAYKQPNVIIGFEINFDDRPTWRQSILALRKQKCPLFLTSLSKSEMILCIDKLRTVLNTSLLPLYFDENKFHSLAPCRRFGSDEVLYRNKYLAII